MQRTLLPLLLLFCAGFWLTSEAYTVIFKTGKVLQGTLISENEESIVFRDDHGIQYSLKKKSLDWDKMTETNSGPPPTFVNIPPTSEKETPPLPPENTKKPSRVYTMKDIETLREKFSGVGTDSPKADVPIVGTVTPEDYLSYLKDASARMGTAVTQLNSLLDGLATAWEVASSTGKDPSISIKEYKSGKAAGEILKTVNNLMSTLDSYKESLGENPPKEYEAAFQSFTQSLDMLDEALNMIQQYDSKQNMTTFRNRITDMFNEIRPKIATLQTMEPAVTHVPAPPPEDEATPEKMEENQNSDQDQSQTSPEDSDQQPPPPRW
jgi:hypothetical protein